MPEPTTSTAAAVAASASLGVGIAVTGLAGGIPVGVIVAAVLGAVIAVNRGDRIELTPRGLWTTFVSFIGALAFGVFGGPLCGIVIERCVERLLGVPLSGFGADAFSAFVLSILGMSVVLPALAKRLGVEIGGRGVADAGRAEP